jgi:hypothetical protein
MSRPASIPDSREAQARRVPGSGRCRRAFNLESLADRTAPPNARGGGAARPCEPAVARRPRSEPSAPDDYGAPPHEQQKRAVLLPGRRPSFGRPDSKALYRVRMLSSAICWTKARGSAGRGALISGDSSSARPIKGSTDPAATRWRPIHTAAAAHSQVPRDRPPIDLEPPRDLPARRASFGTDLIRPS